MGHYYQSFQNQEGFKRLCVEILVRVFNDVQTIEWFQYYCQHYNRYRDNFSKNKLKKHFEAIDWLMEDREQNIYLRFLQMENMTDEAMWRAIKMKIEGKKQFCKVLEEIK